MPLWKYKLKAFGTHLGISLVIFLVLLYFIVFEWYPPPFFTTDGGWQGIRIIAAVDLVLGPVLTLIVFKPGKRGLKFDLSLIALAQIGALVWGIWAVYNERPVAVVFAEDAFNPVPAYLMSEQGVATAQLERYGEDFPVTIYSDLPLNDFDKMQQLRLRAFRSGVAMHLFTEYYTPLDAENIKIINKQAMNMPLYAEVNPKAQQAYTAFKTDYNNQLSAVNFFRLHARHERRIIAAERDTMEFIATLAVKPPNPKQEIKMEQVLKSRQKATANTQSDK